MSRTQDNIKDAFAGESQANRKYLAFARKATLEGKPGLSKLFEVAAEGETVHAANHFEALGEVKSSEDNLMAAIQGEKYEIETMYPKFIAEASEDNASEAEIRTLSRAEKVEEIHKRLFEEALEAIRSGKDVPKVDYYVCSVCGYPAIENAPENCPICGAPKSQCGSV